MSESRDEAALRIKEEVRQERYKSSNPNSEHWDIEPFRRFAAWLTEGQEPVAEWEYDKYIRCLRMRWKGGYVAKSGDKLFLHPPPTTPDAGKDEVLFLLGKLTLADTKIADQAARIAELREAYDKRVVEIQRLLDHNAAITAQRDRLVGVLEDDRITLHHARTFTGSREKMHPVGRELYEQCVARIAEVLDDIEKENQG